MFAPLYCPPTHHFTLCDCENSEAGKEPSYEKEKGGNETTWSRGSPSFGVLSEQVTIYDVRAALRHQRQPFDDPDWIDEISHDGFRAFAMMESWVISLRVRRNDRQILGACCLAT